MPLDKQILVIYHGDCPDGFCAAWMAWRALGDKADYYPTGYDQPAPDVRGKDVYIVDFSYPYEVTLQIIEQARTVVILDHHATAEKDLARIPAHGDKHLIVFDQQRSGAGITRDVLQPGLNCWIVDYTQDRDLWRFDLPDSKEISAYLQTIPQDFARFEQIHESMTPSQAAESGRGALAYKDMYVRTHARHAIRQRFAGYEDIPVVNAPYVGISELVGYLAENALFAVGWFQRSDGAITYSLRSKGDFDVSKLAEKFSGGGHKNAAGFRRDWQVPEIELPETSTPEDKARLVLTPGQAARDMAGRITITEDNHEHYWNLIAQAAIDAAQKL